MSIDRFSGINALFHSIPKTKKISLTLNPQTSNFPLAKGICDVQVSKTKMSDDYSIEKLNHSAISNSGISYNRVNPKGDIELALKNR
jgi:hypothetical protein